MEISNNTGFLKNFYTEDLFIVHEKAPTTNETKKIMDKPASDIKIKGENKKGVLILIDEPEHHFLSEKDMDFLEKILKNGLDMGFDDVGLVNLHKINDRKAVMEIAHKYMIGFGIPDNILEDPGPGLYHLFKRDENTFLLADKLQDIMANIDKKKALWSNLKQMFNIK